MSMTFHPGVLDIDPESVAGTIADELKVATARVLKRRGMVVGVSGGVDSALCLALAVRALGPERVIGLLMPERETTDGSGERGAALCDRFGVQYFTENIGPVLAAAGCYDRRDAAIREVFSDYGRGYKQKVTIAADVLNSDRLTYFNLTVESPDGQQSTRRLPVDVYNRVVAATNMKQRTRKLIEYFHAEARNYAVMGTPNRLEYELGFFVRGGDGLADVKPIAHLYKTQVYRLAEYFDLPEEIRTQPPTTETYSLPQTQEEFYFGLPYAEMDLLLWAWEHEVAPERVGAIMNLGAEQVGRVYRDIIGKRRVAHRSLMSAVMVDDVDVSERP
jgi:NAD+ synthase